MENQDLSGMDYELWSKKILSFYWIIVILSFIGHCVGLLVTIYYFPEYIFPFLMGTVVLPAVIQLFIMLVCEYIIRVKKIYSSRLLIIAGTLIALVVIAINPNVPGLQMTLLLPIAVSLIFFEKRKLLFSLIVNIIGLTLVYLLFPSIRMAVTEYEYLSYIFALCGGYIIYLAILQRGNEVLDVLRKSSEKERELIVKSAMMEKLSKTDALTGLYNHRTFHEYMDFLVEHSEKNNMRLQLAILDIDNFKQINDEFGHSAGDKVLKKVADVLLAKASTNDIVARYGGEEFAILFTEKSLEESLNQIEEVRLTIAGLYPEELQGRIVTVSVGFKDFEHGLTKSDFFNQADTLLYKAKKDGKNQVIYIEKIA